MSHPAAALCLHPNLAELILAEPGCAAMKDAPVTPTRSARSPLAAGASAAESALIGDHLWAIVPARKTRTRSPTAAHKIRPLSAFLMVSVVPAGLAGAAGQLVAAVRAIVGAVACGWLHAAVRPTAPASIVPRSIAALRILTSGSRRTRHGCLPRHFDALAQASVPGLYSAALGLSSPARAIGEPSGSWHHRPMFTPSNVHAQ
jgi:hypothetical protein